MGGNVPSIGRGPEETPKKSQGKKCDALDNKINYLEKIKDSIFRTGAMHGCQLTDGTMEPTHRLSKYPNANNVCGKYNNQLEEIDNQIQNLLRQKNKNECE